MGRESSLTVTIGKIGRTALGIALKAARLMEVGSPYAFRKAMIEAPRRHEQTASLASNGLARHFA